MTDITYHYTNGIPPTSLGDVSKYCGWNAYQGGSLNGTPALRKQKIAYINQSLNKLKPTLKLSTQENASNYQIRFTKSVNREQLKLVNNWLLTALSQEKQQQQPVGRSQEPFIGTVSEQLHFSFDDYKLKFYAVNKKTNRYDLIIYSKTDDLKKVISFNNYSNLNYSQLIIDKSTVVNNKLNTEERSLVIIIPKNKSSKITSAKVGKVRKPSKNLNKSRYLERKLSETPHAAVVVKQENLEDFFSFDLLDQE